MSRVLLSGFVACNPRVGLGSSGIGLILGRYRLLRDLGGTLAVQGADPQVTRLLQLSGIADLVVLEGGTRV